MLKNLTALSLAALALAAPAWAKDTIVPADAIKAAKSPAWSLRANQQEMIVSVSPARQTLQFLGSTGMVLGTGISAIADDKYRRQVDEVLQGYDAGKVFEEKLTQRLQAAISGELTQVNGITSAAGYADLRAAERARYDSLGKSGRDLLLDLKMTYGLFGFEGTLIAKLEGDLHEIPSGHRVWDDVLVVTSEPMLASDRLTDPTKMLSASFSSPRLSVEEGAISQWTGDGGKELRARFEEAVDGVVSAMLTDLGLVSEANGAYFLGQVAMNRKDFDEANAWFDKSIALDPANLDAKNGKSVNLARAKEVVKAIAIAQDIVAGNPDYAPAQFNLAWWYATELKDATKARPYYEKALALGMSKEKKIDKVLDGKGKKK